MKALQYIALTIVILFAQLSAIATPPRMAQAASNASGWNVVMVDNSGTNVGRQPSIAINPKTQRPFVSYYDAGKGALRLANQNGSANGTCSGFGWDCVELVNVGTSGMDNTLRFVPDNSGAYDIAYSDPENSAVYIRRVAANGSASTATMLAWKTDAAAKLRSVRFASLAYRQNLPRIAYYKSFPITYPDGDIRASGMEYEGITETFGDAFSEIDYENTSDEDVSVDNGYYVSLDIGDDLYPRVAFRGYSNQNLRYAAHSSGNSCRSSGQYDGHTQWGCATVDPTPKTGYYITYRAPKTFGTTTTKHQIAYYDGTNGLVKYAQYVGGSSTCGAGGAVGWKCVVIDNVGNHNGAMGVSMTLDNNGSPVIAYYDRNDANHGVLKVARPVGNEIGNCGPVELFATWKCTVADDGGAGGDDVGQMASVAVDANNKAYVAYYNTGYQALMVAHEQLDSAPLFTKAYGVATLKTQASTSVTYTIKNPSENPTLTDLKFADGLVGGMTFQPGSIKNTCGGAVVFGNNNHAIKLTGGQLKPNITCSVTATVIGSQLGTFEDTTTALASNETVNAPIASATIRVVSPVTPTFSKSYTPATVILGAPTTVQYTIKNNLPNDGLTEVAFNDVFPAGISVKPNTITNTCGGTLSIVSNGQKLVLVGGTIAKGAACTVKATIVTSIGGVYSDPASKLTTDQTVYANSAQATLTVTNPVPVLTKLSQTTAKKGSPAFTLTLTGSKFAPNSVVRWHGVDHVTTFVNSTTLKAQITAQDLLAVGPHNVRVFTPTPGGGKSAIIIFTVQP